ncbi:hypothetical protein [Dysgonomonas sp. 25]|uniref:hypothetical protein n=1 Tax=Dysgonomonas sp. 25 TaxID=2302933 RepID=UPI0013D57165|nr:hypothetical protein [Dysgonomonas sp. 25]NDV68173.1 hypothetical protein [Dysgonomonas sp. 25]
MAITIKEVNPDNKALMKDFVRFPVDTLYKDCPYYVPSLTIDALGTLNPKKNPAFDFCEMQIFLAYRDNKIVGRIAAIINHNVNRTWGQKNGRFGFVDFIDDAEVADTLFATAEKWLKEKGMDRIMGPLGFCDLDHEGLLIHGYDRVSTMSTTYSYPYYKEHIERLGFEKEVDWKEFYIPVPEDTPERHKRISKMVAERYGLKMLKFKNYKEMGSTNAHNLFELLNKAYKPLFGFSPLTTRQIDYYIDMYVPLLRWDLVSMVIKEDTNEAVGFGISVPNLSKALIKSRGKLLPFGWTSLLKDMKGKSNKIADLMLIGIAPEYQGKGVNAMIFNDFIPSAYRNGFRFVETNPELEQNNKMVSLWDGFEAEHHKTRRAYSKKIQ